MKLFIGNLSFETTEAEFRELFEPFEPILEYIRPLNRETGAPRGFAFVTLADAEKGNAAIEALDGVELGGRQIKVNEAEDRGHSPPPFAPQRFRNDLNDDSPKPVDDRPVDSDGKKKVYKSL